MRDRRWKKVIRDVWLYKTRSILVILAIATSLAGAGTVLNAWALVERATEDAFLSSNPPDATVHVDSIDDAVVNIVRNVAGVEHVQARRVTRAAARVNGTMRTTLLMAYDDFDNVKIGALERSAGQWPPADGSIVVEQSSVDFAGASVNTPIALSVAGRDAIELTVTGFARDVGLAPGWMEHILYAFVTPQTLKQLGANSSFNELRITVHDHAASRSEVQAIVARVVAALRDAGKDVGEVDVPEPGKHIHAAQMDSLLITQGAFGVLALVAGALLVVNLLSAILASQVREIGVMKTIGADTRQLAGMYLAYAASIGGVATLVAIPVAMVLGRCYGELKAELLNVDASVFAIPSWAILLQVLAGILIPLLASMIPVMRGCRTTVAQALRDVGIEHDGRVDSATSLTTRLGLSRPTALSIRNAFRKRQRMVLTTLVLASGGAIFIGARNLRASVIGSLDLVFGAQQFEFAVRLTEPHAVDSITAAVSEVEGVRIAEAWSGTRASVSNTDGTITAGFPVTAPPADTRLLDPKLTTGRWVSDGTMREIVVNRTLQQQYPALAPGAEVSLLIAGTVATWTVVGVVESGPSPAAYAARDGVAAATGSSGATTVVIDHAELSDFDQLQLIQQVRSALERSGMPVASSQLLAENRRVTEDHLLMVVQFLGVMGWVMILIGGMALSSTMGLSVLERTREIGVMRAIGAQHSSILRLVQAEGLMIALVGWLCALPLSVPISTVLAVAFSRIMLRVPILWLPQLEAVLLWLGLAVVVSLLACCGPAIRAMRVSVREALAYE